MNSKLSVVVCLILALGMSLLLHTPTVTSHASFIAQDPGVRGGDVGAGGPIAGLSPSQLAFFTVNRLRVFRTANTAHLGRGIGQGRGCVWGRQKST
jgi:hypothetical protein